MTQFPSQRAEIRELLDLAIEQLQAMGMQPYLERALALQDRPSTPIGPLYPAGLSEREVEVLRLIAAGASNRDIAETLVISLNTVARHVNHILAKTNTANRAEAAIYAVHHGLL